MRRYDRIGLSGYFKTRLDSSLFQFQNAQSSAHEKKIDIKDSFIAIQIKFEIADKFNSSKPLISNSVLCCSIVR
jgi:hypothetical protein